MANNDAAFIAIQAGQPTVLVGGSGEGKTAMAEQLCKDKLGLEPVTIIPSQHMPEDIGGLPHINKDNGSVTMVHMDRLLKLKQPGHALIIDELTTASQAMRPTLLSLLNEGRIGDLKIHPSNLRMACMNPDRLAPNGTPLEPTLCNRLYHHQWKVPFDSWLEGMENGGDFRLPHDLPIVGDYEAYVPLWCRRVAYLLRRQPALRYCTVDQIDGEVSAFPSLRMWHGLARCLAAAQSVQADGTVYSELACGMVGPDGGHQLMASIKKRELYDADELIEGTSVIDYDKCKVDQLVYIPCGVLEALIENHDDERIERSINLLFEMCEHGLTDCVAPVMSDINKRFPESFSDDYKVKYGQHMQTLMAGGVA